MGRLAAVILTNEKCITATDALQKVCPFVEDQGFGRRMQSRQEVCLTVVFVSLSFCVTGCPEKERCWVRAMLAEVSAWVACEDHCHGFVF